MATLITLPDELSERLKPQAANQHMDLDAYVIELLNRLSNQPATIVFVEPIETIVARIKALPPVAPKLYPGTYTLTHTLAHFVEDATFDAADWDRQWAVVEAEIKTISRVDRLAEGRA
jgi:hypothetical protein